MASNSLVSHLQYLGDIILWYVFKGVEHGVYVDIDPSDPLNDSLSLLFYEQGWRGVHIEASLKGAKLLRRARPGEIVIEAAVADGRQRLVTFHECVDPAAFCNSSIDLPHFQTQEYTIPVVTLDDVFQHIQAADIHWLRVDIQNHEKQILEGWQREYRPWVVMFACVSASSYDENYRDWEELLLAKDYVFACADPFNRYYVHCDHEELTASFHLILSKFDGFQVSTQSNFFRSASSMFRQELRDLQEECEKLRLECSAAIAQRDYARAECGAVVTQRDALLASRSWYVTKPLRFGGRLLRRLLSPCGAVKPLLKKCLCMAISVVSKIPILNTVARWLYNAIIPASLVTRIRHMRMAQQEKLIFEHAVSAQTIWPAPKPIDLFDTPSAGITRLSGERVIYYYIDHTAATGVNSGVQQTARHIAIALLERGEKLRFVKWSPNSNGIIHCNADDMNRFTMNGAIPIPQAELERHHHDSTACLIKDDIQPGDWLLCPECPHITVHQEDPTSNLLYAAKSLHLRTAFVFYDATPLKFSNNSTINVPRHAEYMRSLLLADLVCCISRHAADDLYAFLTLHENAATSTLPRIEVLPGLGCKSPKVAPTTEATSKIILSVGSIMTHKNQIAMIKAFAWAKTMGDLSGWKMRLVGNIHGDLEKEIYALAAECRDVCILGGVSDDALDEEYRRCAFTVFPSIMEGYGLPIIESLSYGKPCICANFGAMAEVAENGACLTVDATDVEALAQAVFRLAADDDLRGELSRQARETIPPSWSDCAAAIADWMLEEDNLPGKLPPVYFCLGVAGELPTAMSPALEIASEMAKQAALIPAVWDATRQCLREWTEAERAALGVSAFAWASWREPEPDNWVIMLSDGGSLTSQATAVQKYASEKRLYSAWTVSEDISDEHREAISTATRLFPVSRRAKGQHIQFLAFNRLPFHSLEHRLQTCQRMDDLPGSARSLAREMLFRMAAEGHFHAPRYEPKHIYTDDSLYAAFINLQRRPKLSICISTYNRAQWLDISLRHICSLLPLPDNNIELLVVDNASTDNTSSIVKPFLERRDFRYIRNAQNVGMLGNLRVTAELARGRHVLILGDDDILHPNAVQTIMAAIERYPDVPMVYHNYTYTFSPGVSSLDELPTLLDASTPVTPPCPDEYGSVLDIATKNENFFTSIYAITFRRDHALRAFSQFTGDRPFSTMRSCIPTSSYVLRYMAREKAYWIGQPQVMVNFNVSWNKYASIHMLERVPELMETLERIGVPHERLEPYWTHNGHCFPVYWREMYTRNDSDNRLYFSPLRVVIRARPVRSVDEYVSDIKLCYEEARLKNTEATELPAEALLGAWLSPDDGEIKAMYASCFGVV